MTPNTANGASPRWANVTQLPDIASWTVAPGFSPTAAWDHLDLVEAYGTTQKKLISRSNAELLEALHLRLLKERINFSPMPSGREVCELFAMKRKYRTARRQAIKMEASSGWYLIDKLARFFTRKPLPRTGLLRELLMDLITQSYSAIMCAKLHYNRVRAYQLFPELAGTFLGRKFPMHPSFPSGHSTQSHLLVKVLEDIFGKSPRTGLAHRSAWRIGKNREIAGLHYPSDTRAGFFFAQVLLEEVLASPDYHLRRAKIRKIYGISPSPSQAISSRKMQGKRAKRVSQRPRPTIPKNISSKEKERQP